jgi:riboflavin biosynthesis pyrimidine reductase
MKALEPLTHCKACFASSVDGKLSAPPHLVDENAWVKLGTPKDLERLFRLRDEADVLCFGASTFRAWRTIRRGLTHQADLTNEPPAHVLFTVSWEWDWDSPLFQEWKAHQHDWKPIFIASPEVKDTCIPEAYRSFIHVISLNPKDSEQEQLTHVKHVVESYFANNTAPRWMLEGGGQLFDFFLRANAVDTLYLTMTPQLIGGNAPSLVGGQGFAPNTWRHIEWTAVEHHPPELYLTGRIDTSKKAFFPLP